MRGLVSLWRALLIGVLCRAVACGSEEGTADALAELVRVECAARMPRAGERLSSGALRCQQLLHRLGLGQPPLLGAPAAHGPASHAWRSAYRRSVSRLTWGMPGCPVERKIDADGGAMPCNSIEEAVAAFRDRPLLMHVVNDAMDWQHFETEAVLKCPFKCLWAGAVDLPALVDVFVYDCLQLPPPHRGRRVWRAPAMRALMPLPRSAPAADERARTALVNRDGAAAGAHADMHGVRGAHSAPRKPAVP